MNIGIIDYGAGNVQSVYNAIYRLGDDPLIIQSYKEIGKQDKLIIPGVGSAHSCIKSLKEKNMFDLIRTFYESEKPILGICLGLQIFCKKLYENGISSGLNIINADVVPFEEDTKTNIGWSDVELNNEIKNKFNCKKNTSLYFCHSYYLKLNSKDNKINCYYSNIFNKKVPAVLEKDNFLGTQFHPEKSQVNGSNLLIHFLKK